MISLIAGVTTYIALTGLVCVRSRCRSPSSSPMTDLIPMIGATLGAVICMIVAVAISDRPVADAALVAIFFVVYQQLENYLIAPRVLRNAVDMRRRPVLLAGLHRWCRARPGRRAHGDPGRRGDQGRWPRRG